MIILTEETVQKVNRTRGRLMELGVEGKLQADEVALLMLALGIMIGSSFEYQRQQTEKARGL